jgi:hypothetical protein
VDDQGHLQRRRRQAHSPKEFCRRAQLSAGLASGSAGVVAASLLAAKRSVVKGVVTHLGRLERVIRRKVDVQEEDAPVIWRILLLKAKAHARACQNMALAVAGCARRARVAEARTGPMMVDCQWKRSSPTGPALQVEGGSFDRSESSLLIRLVAEPPPLITALR